MQELRKWLALGGILAAIVLAALVLWPRRRIPSLPMAVDGGVDGFLTGPSPTPSPAAAAVDGRVIDELGRPISGARVEVTGALHPGAAPARFEPLGELGVVRGAIPFPPAQPVVTGPSTLTDADGRFFLGGLPPGPAVVSAWRADFSPKSASLELTGGARASVELVLLAAAPVPPEMAGEARLEGGVVDERGFPVAGARVEVGGASVLTDRAGRFQLDGLPDGPHHVRATHADFTPAEAEVAAGDDVQLQLLPGGGIEGDLRDPRTGDLPLGATLELIADGVVQRVSLGAGGRFTVTGVRAGRVSLSARAPGYVAALRELEVPSGERPGEVTVRELSLELVRGGAVVGSVRDDGGNPLAGAQVTAGAVRTRSDARGEFRLEGVTPGHVRVSVSGGGHHAVDEVEVAADEESRVELTAH